MKPLRKVQAGGILRVSLDNTWRTPPHLVEAAARYFGGRIPFDAATGLENPTGAERYATSAGPVEAADWLYRASRGASVREGLGELVHLGPPGRVTFEGVARAAVGIRALELPWRSGLVSAWDWPTWVNPPYGRELREWLKKIEREAARGSEIVGLLPCARWEQRYFHRVLRAARAICFIKGRVAFISSIDHVPVGGNPYANMLVGWNTDARRFHEAFSPLGACFEMKPLRRRPVLLEGSRQRSREAEGISLFGGEL